MQWNNEVLTGSASSGDGVVIHGGERTGVIHLRGTVPLGAQNTDIGGTWTAELRNAKVFLQVRTAPPKEWNGDRSGGDWNMGQSFPIEELPGLPSNDDQFSVTNIKFDLRREAGTLAFAGAFRDGRELQCRGRAIHRCCRTGRPSRGRGDALDARTIDPSPRITAPPPPSNDRENFAARPSPGSAPALQADRDAAWRSAGRWPDPCRR